VMTTPDVTRLLGALVRCPSVTPDAGAALDLAAGWLAPCGFDCHRLVFEADGTAPVDNLFARLGTGSPHFCFAGHLDVVPPGETSAWSSPPFAGDIADGKMIGRGTEDMKGGVAAFIAAVLGLIDAGGATLSGSVSLLLTGDEEGPAVNGTVKVLEWMAENGHTPDHCLVGEPTGVNTLGDVAKIGRRGSLNGHLTVRGKQGHVAYPARAANPIPMALDLIAALTEPLDEGTGNFEASNLQITSIDAANTAVNIIPGRVEILFNCRFNDRWTSAGLEVELRRRLNAVAAAGATSWQLKTSSNAQSFITATGTFTNLVAKAVKDTIGIEPELTTGGGTSDARFVTKYCPVVEFGLVGRSMHQVDEYVPVSDLETLACVYRLILERYFEQPD